MRNEILAPIIILVLVGGFSAILLAGSQDRNGGTGWQYDERQIRAQGKAFMWGFFAMMAAGLAVIITDSVREGFVPAGVAAVLIMCPGAAVMGVYCVVHDAYVSVKGSGPAAAVSSGLLAVVALWHGFDSLSERGALTDGRLGFCWGHFALSAVCFAVFLSLVVKLILDRRRGE